MRSLGLFNILWDGGSHYVGRRTSESYTVKGARLTIALQIQQPTLRGLMRGTDQALKLMVVVLLKRF